MALLYKISINNYIYVFEYSYIIRFNICFIMTSVVFCLCYDCQIKILFQWSVNRHQSAAVTLSECPYLIDVIIVHEHKDNIYFQFLIRCMPIKYTSDPITNPKNTALSEHFLNSIEKSYKTETRSILLKYITTHFHGSVLAKNYLGKMLRRWKSVPHMSKMSTLVCKWMSSVLVKNA